MPGTGLFLLAEIAAVRLPFGLRIERDETFAAAIRSLWAQTARIWFDHAGRNRAASHRF
jgi:predicted proteasome-type protease